jgi:DNA-directed RNA polymerase specialized sigma24 family protein
VAEGELDVQDAMGSLPHVYLLVLRAALVGFDDAQLAALVGVPPESVRPLLRVAAAKLGRALATPPEPD